MAKVSAEERARIFGQPGQVPRVSYMTPWGVATQCHKLILPLFSQACEEAFNVPWDPKRIDSYNPRPIRGTDGDRLEEWSLHSWCLAWDFFVTPPNVPPPGGVWTPDNGVPVEFAACFERRGFRWGGRWSTRPDTPHIEWAGGMPPPVEEETDMPLNQQDLNVIRLIVAEELAKNNDTLYERLRVKMTSLRDSLATLIKAN